MRPLLLACLVVSLLPACTPSSPPAFSADEQQAMAAVVQDAVDRGDIPGIIVGVWSGDKEWVVVKGVSDVTTRAPMDRAMSVRIGSITKSMTALLVLQLAQEEKLSLDDGIGRYVDGIPNGGVITIRQLLDMSSGIFNYTDIEGFESGMVHDPLRIMVIEDLVHRAVTDPRNPRNPPGQGFYYSNTSYVILGEIVERVTGHRVKDEIQDRIAKPLGLAGTYLPETASMPDGASRGYFYDPSTAGPLLDITELSPTYTWTAGGVISRLEEVKRYVKALGNGDLIGSRMRAEQVKLNPASRFEDRYGYGLGISYVNGFIGHNGSIPGYNSSAYHHPGKDITIVVLANQWRIPHLSLGTDSIFVSLGKVLAPELNWQGLDQ